MSDRPFKVIDGGLPEKAPRRSRKQRTLSMWECRLCEAAIGVRTRTIIKVRDQPMQDERLRITGGRDKWVCAHCLARGVVTPVTA